MGQSIIKQIAARNDCRLSVAVTNRSDPNLGKDAGLVAGISPAGVVLVDDLAPLCKGLDVVIDFTRPQPCLYHAGLAAKQGVAFVSGTTGLDAEQMASLKKYAADAPVLWAANMSLGVNLLRALVRQAAATLGPEYDIEIVEMHHRHKVDAPSGTALALGESAATGRGIALSSHMQGGRMGDTGARPEGEIGFAVLRGGDVAGDHRVIFAGEGERLELAHLASNRDIFAKGAVKAACWLAGKPAGFYGMDDLLGL
jgi:4-hydroxy-tetrahydrodipicolinate reductase